jgi:hypothetical protein
MSNYEAINMESIDLAARQERAAYIAELAKVLRDSFVSIVRNSSVKTLARLQAA